MYKTKETAIKHLIDGEDFKNKVFDLFRGNKEVVLAAVSQNGNAFQFASEELRADKDVVLASIAANPLSGVLEFASNELRADKEVVLAAINQHGNNFRHASPELQADKEVVLAAVSYFGYALQDVSSAFQNDKEVVLAAVSKQLFSNALEFASDEIKELVGDSPNPAAKLQSIIEKEALQAKMAARGININKERDNDVGFAL